MALNYRVVTTLVVFYFGLSVPLAVAGGLQMVDSQQGEKKAEAGP